MKSPDVLISGAGPTGLMLACLLANQGISFRIFDLV
jgi:2-polyprenyl-6-methoxyphenol hydroxylase-like FAD-dependent oxidoreductase